MMEKEFIPYELAVKLKALGFDEECFGAYHNENYLDLESEEYDYSYAVKAPIFSQAFRWFREKYVLFSGVLSEYSYGGKIHAYHINCKRQETISKGSFITYEEAELACLEKLIEIVRGQKD